MSVVKLANCLHLEGCSASREPGRRVITHTGGCAWAGRHTGWQAPRSPALTAPCRAGPAHVASPLPASCPRASTAAGSPRGGRDGGRCPHEDRRHMGRAAARLPDAGASAQRPWQCVATAQRAGERAALRGCGRGGHATLGHPDGPGRLLPLSLPQRRAGKGAGGPRALLSRGGLWWRA